MSEWLGLGGVNEAYALELYERYLADPTSVDPVTREAFERSGPPVTRTGPRAQEGGLSPVDLRAIVGAVNLAESIRRYGHLAARIDPLGSDPVGDPSLHPETHGLTEADLRTLPASLAGGPLAEGAANAGEAIERLRNVYCS